jgi:hypothetical protein
LSCELLSAGTFGGKAVVNGVQSGALLNTAIQTALRESGAQSKAAAELVRRQFPRAAVSRDGQLWLRREIEYVAVGAVKAWDVDDVDGTIYATNPERAAYRYDAATGQWVDTGVRGALDIEASAGTLFALLGDGTVIAQRGGSSVTLRSIPEGGSLLATQGLIYVLTRTGVLHRLGGTTWETLARNVRGMVANGRSWYGLDAKGHVYSGDENRYIDQEGDAVALWMVGRDLLSLSRAGSLFYYESADKHWHSIGD